MFKFFSSIKIIVLVIIFMALAVIASVRFNGDEEDNLKLSINHVWQAGSNTVASISLFVSSLSKLNKEKLIDNNHSELNQAQTELEEKLKRLKPEEIFSSLKEKFSNKTEITSELSIE